MSNERDGEPGDGLTVSGSSFTGNEGGALAVFNTDLEVSGSNFNNNEGAVYFETSDEDRGFNLEVRQLLQLSRRLPLIDAPRRGWKVFSFLSASYVLSLSLKNQKYIKLK